MKIECPDCKLTGEVSDVNIPAEGRNMECPRCKGTFYVKKTAPSSWTDTLTDCPECGFSTFSGERFDICPQCGLVAKDAKAKPRQRPRPGVAKEPASLDPEAMRQELERLERVEMKKQRRLSGSDALLLPEEQQVPESVTVPAPVQYVGWGVVLAGLIVLVWGAKDFYEYRQYLAALAASEPEVASSGFVLYLQHGLLPSLQVLLGVYSVAAGHHFTMLRSWARKGVEGAVWGGIACVVVVEISGLIAWFRRSSDSASFLYYLVGIGDTLLMSALWLAPLGVLVLFLRGELICDAFDD